jgi:predicted transcriptional regulator
MSGLVPVVLSDKENSIFTLFPRLLVKEKMLSTKDKKAATDSPLHGGNGLAIIVFGKLIGKFISIQKIIWSLL